MGGGGGWCGRLRTFYQHKRRICKKIHPLYLTSHLCPRTPRPPSAPSRLSCAALTSSGSAEAPCGPHRSHCRHTSWPQGKAARAPAAQRPERRVGRRHRRRRRHRWLSRAAAPSRAPQQSAACARARIARRQGARPRTAPRRYAPFAAWKRVTSRQCPTRRATRLAPRHRRRHARCGGPLGSVTRPWRRERRGGDSPSGRLLGSAILG